ncbi:hypothetical protein CEXT_89611 [Caerostris extrusa]|uniref:Transmembrane protein n=1 Tax=Caerostris extrusa TaxID=172846 RepID=A0AAV4PEW3_CAEEX|nr:hypothetical protein CEXT_89611 [Caerostris extrusa]
MDIAALFLEQDCYGYCKIVVISQDCYGYCKIVVVDFKIVVVDGLQDCYGCCNIVVMDSTLLLWMLQHYGFVVMDGATLLLWMLQHYCRGCCKIVVGGFARFHKDCCRIARLLS